MARNDVALRGRDNQRSKVYAWERKVTAGMHYQASLKTLEECEAYMTPIWKAERGRYGLAKRKPPAIERPSRGQRSAIAHDDHRITLPRWSRNPWVILHELAHRLTPNDEGHGPRFVGVLIGLAARHLGHDASTLMHAADEAGVKYHVRAIGAVPVRDNPAAVIERAITTEGPMTEMDIACWCDMTYLQVRGAAMHLIKTGRARWLRKKLTLVGAAAPLPPAPPEKPKRAPRKGVKELAKEHGIELERTDTMWWVWPPHGLKDDPYEEHFCDDGWPEVIRRVHEYIKLKEGSDGIR